MKILYVDLKYDYGIESRGINHIGRDGFLQSFIDLGHEVFTLYFDEYLTTKDVLQSVVRDRADEIKPDLIFFILFLDQFEAKTLEYLKSKYTTVNWFGDDQWRFDAFSSKYAKYFDYCITTDQYAVSKYKRIGQDNVIYSQWAAIQTHPIPEFQGYQRDVAFIGGFHPYRKWFIDRLISAGIHVEVFGHGWSGGAITIAEMNNLFSSSKINLNIGNSISFDSRYLLSGIRPLVNSFRSPKNAPQIKARNFEIPFFNGFQLTDYVPFIENYFDPGKEIVLYRDVDDAITTIQYYLEHEAERESIKKLGHERALREHGYINRLQDAIGKIQ